MTPQPTVTYTGGGKGRVDVGYYPPVPPSGGPESTTLLIIAFVVCLILALLAHRMGW